MLLNLYGQITDIIALITVIRKSDILSRDFPVSKKNRKPQCFYLPARVIYIVFLLNIISAKQKDIRHSISHSSAAAMPDMKRPGGVGTDKFHLDFPAVSDI